MANPFTEEKRVDRVNTQLKKNKSVLKPTVPYSRFSTYHEVKVESEQLFK